MHINFLTELVQGVFWSTVMSKHNSIHCFQVCTLVKVRLFYVHSVPAKIGCKNSLGQDGAKMGQGGAKVSQDGAKMSQDEPRWRQDGPRRGQDAPRWRQDGPRWSQDGRRWRQKRVNK